MASVYLKSRIKELENLIKKYQNSYYNGEAEVSDAEFDELWDELTQIDPDNPLLKKVGMDSGNFKKVKHIMMMGSQQKANEPNEIADWFRKTQLRNIAVQYKLDGASIELQYENGYFVKGVTRGNGVIGDDVTENVKRMRGLVLQIPGMFTGAIRGEVLMFHGIFNSIFHDSANCRNAANGIMKRLDGVGCEYLNIIAYDIFSTKKMPIECESDKCMLLNQWGFDTPLITNQYCESVAQAVEFVNETRQFAIENRDLLQFDIDGIVIKSEKIIPEDLERERPQYQIAYKFDLEAATTKIRDVIWNRNGKTYTPVAVFDPVHLNGTTVTQASIANWGKFMEMSPCRNDTIKVVKRGEIIPKVVDCIHDSDSGDLFQPPSHCERCGATLNTKNSVFLVCDNPNCLGGIEHKIQKFTDVHGMMGFGPTIISSLVDGLGLKSLFDFLNLKINHIEESTKIGSAIATKLVKEIRKVINEGVTMDKYIAGFDIPGIGVEKAADFIEKYKPKDADDLIKIVRGLRRSRTPLNSAHENSIREMSDENFMDLCRCMTVMKIKEMSEFVPLKGLEFVFSGHFDLIDRTKAGKIVTKYGGKYALSISRKTTYLVCNEDAGSSKYRRAQKLGVPIISDSDFIAILKKNDISYSKE